MAEHELAHRAAEGHGPEDLGADTRVNLDALELFGRERLGLREDVLGHGHVADVVEQRRRPHHLHLGIGQAGRFRQHAGVLLNRSDVLGRAPRLGFDRERERFNRRQLDVHGPARLVLFFAQPRHDRVVAAEHEIERDRQQGEPSEPAACRSRRRDCRQRGADQVARRAPQKIAMPHARHRLPGGQRDGARDERRVDEEVERRHHGGGPDQRGEARRAESHEQPERKTGDPHGQRQRTDAEDDAVHRVPPVHAERALCPRADRRDADRLCGAQREQGPEVHHVRERQVRRAAAERQLDLRRRGDHPEQEQHREQPDVLETELHRRADQAGGSGGDDRADIHPGLRRQLEERWRVGQLRRHTALASSSAMRRIRLARRAHTACARA